MVRLAPSVAGNTDPKGESWTCGDFGHGQNLVAPARGKQGGTENTFAQRGRLFPQNVRALYSPYAHYRSPVMSAASPLPPSAPPAAPPSRRVLEAYEKVIIGCGVVGLIVVAAAIIGLPAPDAGVADTAPTLVIENP